jgi:hypothetical protein
MSERERKIIDLFSEATKRGKSISQRIAGDDNAQIGGNVIAGKATRKRHPSAEEGISQSIKGNGNVQVAGDFIDARSSIIKVLPPTDSIGSDPLLKETIMAHFNRLGEEREKRFGKNAYRVMYRKFKKDFCIEHNAWTIIWTWPKDCSEAIIDYLNKKYDETIQGRIERAAKREGYPHRRPFLYKREAELLEHLGYCMDSPEVKGALSRFFGSSSHSELSRLQHWQWVNYLESRVKEIRKRR